MTFTKRVEMYNITLSETSHSRRHISHILSYMKNLDLKIKLKIYEIRKSNRKEEGDEVKESRSNERGNER